MLRPSPAWWCCSTLLLPHVHRSLPTPTEMGQCSDWHAMCKADPSLIFCHGSGGSGSGSGSGSGGATAGPVMKMYFFEELPFYLLFKQWTPRNGAELSGAWVAIFALGLLYELLQMLYARYEARFWARYSGGCGTVKSVANTAARLGSNDIEHGRPLAEGVENGVALTATISDGAQCKGCCSGSGAGSTEEPNSYREVPRASSKGAAVMSRQPAAVRRRALSCLGNYCQPELIMMDVIRGVARFVLAGLAYLLMLAAMSYHVAIFFAVISGVGVGSMLFGRWRFNAGTAEGYSHCGCGSS